MKIRAGSARISLAELVFERGAPVIIGLTGTKAMPHAIRRREATMTEPARGPWRASHSLRDLDVA
ncbi:hypothetical protein TW79_21265 [Tritonibacter mobilis]|uniref:Uncharacterized protein n=1 Tax=Tritonibacter mobilis F1926 TaxID=1265309 RepID=A0A1B1A5A6_9RHOB|nr:hypothetical protein K529_013035 [Tritonibacter mobilis F1926]KJZ21743.1 hypothetical protein TW79_21265 [Tritonibacter mobilis]